MVLSLKRDIQTTLIIADIFILGDADAGAGRLKTAWPLKPSYPLWIKEQT